jgi:outer membrane lipoprotein-sorting protein
MIKRSLTAFLFALLLPVAAVAAPLSEDEKDDLSRIENYLNGISTLKSRFIQTSSTGPRAAGTVYLQRPGRMRFEYNPPSPILLVADGLFVIYVDLELEQISHVPISATPLRVLIEADVNLVDGHDVQSVKRGPGTLAVTLTVKDDPDAGALRLLFTEAPLALKQWVIRDAQGIEVRVTLLEAVRGLDFDPRLFQVDEDMFGTTDNQR